MTQKEKQSLKNYSKAYGKDCMIVSSKEKLDSVKADIVILDGVPRNLTQAEKMKEYGIKIDCIVYLPISEDEAVKRAANRLVCSNPSCQAGYTLSDFKPPKKKGICDKCGSPLTKRPDDNEETVRQRLRIYEEKTLPLLQFYQSDTVTVTIEDGSFDRFIEAIKAISG